MKKPSCVDGSRKKVITYIIFDYYFHEWSTYYFVLYDSGRLVGYKNKPERSNNPKPRYHYDISCTFSILIAYIFTPFSKGQKAYFALNDNWLNALKFVKASIITNKKISTIPPEYKLQEIEETMVR
ncbi:hypothetical protein RF11_10836 [Thelohanellus kitauei]|uniref:Uncharacterized protein n=1 Tax=Thelohanellus kitauei TaxID=669202 RepID=A0A0C2IGH2_THEKT|nr:hypothetical protein RF11_10836 [Thelohanellus kitauei]